MAARFRVLITDRAWPDLQIEREILEPLGAEIIDAPAQSEDVLTSLAAGVDAIGTCWAKVTPTVIRSAGSCKVISRYGIGLDNISLITADELGIPVTNVPDYCLPEVSDHALGLLLACERKIAFYHQQSKQGESNLQAGPVMRRLSECTLGLIGFGRIARALYPKAKSLGLNVLAHSRSGNSHGFNCEMVDLPELLQRSDFISIHAPLTSETENLFDENAFSQMKSGAYLINTARAEIISLDALQQALDAGSISGAALDVVADSNHPVLQHPHVIVTPHAAFLSRESLLELRTQATIAIRKALLGEPLENVVNLHNQHD